MADVEHFVSERFLATVDAVNNREEGQGLVEYALIIALVAVLLTAALTALRGGVSNTFSSITSSL